MSIYYKDTLVAGAGGTPNALPLSGGTMTGEINMDGNKVTGLPAPTADLDAVTKAYLDNAIASAVVEYLAKAGGNMTGAINMGGNKITALGNPTAASDAATKSYVDSAVPSGTFLPTTGGTMSGNINMGEHYISNVAEVPISSAYTGYTIPLSQMNDLFFSRKGLNVMQAGATIDMGANRVRNIATPTTGTDAASKAYVDANAGISGIFPYTGTGGTAGQTITFNKKPAFIIVFSTSLLFIVGGSDPIIRCGFAVQGQGTPGLTLANSTLTVGNAGQVQLNQNGTEYLVVSWT